jgi:hypothetical protein
VAEPRDDLPHPVPPQAFMTWKENWVFPALDQERRAATLFHFSLRPAAGEGIFTAKLCLDGWEHRYVGRSPVPRDVTELHPVANERLSLEVVEPGERFRIVYASDELDAELEYTGRFPTYDFAEGPRAPGESVLGDIGRCVFPYNHCEQSLVHEGRLAVKAGPLAGETLEVGGFACRDHSWGWRDDLGFREHHWVCASFGDRYVQGSVMRETSYPHGPKSGGWISTAAGNDPVVDVDTSAAYWLAQNEPLPVLDRDVRYRIRTVGGSDTAVVAHLEEDYGRLYLNARSPDRTQVYQDVQIFCDYTREETGERGCGVLEVGKFVTGADVVERTRASASRA